MSKRFQRLKRIWRAFWQEYWRGINPVQRARVLGTITASLTIGAASLGSYILLQWFFADVIPTWGEIKAAAATGITSSGLAYQIFPKHVQMKLAATTSPEPTMIELTDELSESEESDVESPGIL